jgi:diketogulonate reductase-like aldo/keto reductase
VRLPENPPSPGSAFDFAFLFREIQGVADLAITPIGFGAWAIGGDWEFGWGAQDDAQSVAAIHRALDLGVNWIDTAAVYGLGHSEEVVARALQEWHGPRPCVFTKCGMVWNEQGRVDYSLRQESIRRDVETAQLPWCRHENVGVIVYSPMASGLLTGAMTRERLGAMTKNDWRTRNEQFKEPKLSENLKLVERLRAVGTRHGRTPGETAIAWTLRQPAVTGAIVGDIVQIEGHTGGIPLSNLGPFNCTAGGGLPATTSARSLAKVLAANFSYRAARFSWARGLIFSTVPAYHITILEPLQSQNFACCAQGLLPQLASSSRLRRA